MTTQLEVAREALAQIGTRTTIAALDDGSPEAQYVNLLYAPIRDFLLVDGDWDFSLTRVLAVLIDSTETFPWTYAYEYPGECLRIRQLIPTDRDALDPRPIEWNISQIVGDRKVILTHIPASYIICTVPALEEMWDAIFRQSFVRMLASALAFALENRIEASKVKLEEALGFAGVGKMRDS